VRGLVEGQTVEAKEFVAKDDRGPCSAGDAGVFALPRVLRRSRRGAPQRGASDRRLAVDSGRRAGDPARAALTVQDGVHGTSVYPRVYPLVFGACEITRAHGTHGHKVT